MICSTAESSGLQINMTDSAFIGKLCLSVNILVSAMLVSLDGAPSTNATTFNRVSSIIRVLELAIDLKYLINVVLK